MSFITNQRRLAINIRDSFTCLYCRKNLAMALPEEITLDHLQPQSLGGSHSAHNLVTSCRSCNSRRGAKSWRKFAKKYYPDAIQRINNQRRRQINLALAKELIAGYGSTERARKAVAK